MWRGKHEESDMAHLSAGSAARAAAFTGPACFALGAAAMYLLDPSRGHRRRTLLRDKLTHSYHRAGEAFCKTAEYTRNRAYGMIAEARSRLTPDNADDWTICQRVRSALGRVLSHPHAIEVAACQGTVRLRGPVLASEANGLLRAVNNVRGVRDVLDELEVHKQPGDMPALQGGRGVAPRARRWGVMDEYWDPFTRLMTSAGGGGLALWGLARRDLIGLAAAGVGAAFAARGLTNLPVRRLTGIGAGRRAIDVQKTITIHAPIADV
jgi:hypothetical protein